MREREDCTNFDQLFLLCISAIINHNVQIFIVQKRTYFPKAMNLTGRQINTTPNRHSFLSTRQNKMFSIRPSVWNTFTLGLFPVRYTPTFLTKVAIIHHKTNTCCGTVTTINISNDHNLRISYKLNKKTSMWEFFFCKQTGGKDFLLFCTMANKHTNISQIITLLHVSTLSCHP